MELNLSGKNALVTGNSRGIGKAISEMLRSEDVYVYNISKTTGYDLMTNGGLEKLFEDVEQVEIMVANLGGMGSCKQEDYKEAMKKNYFVNMDIINHYLPKMVANGWGRVIFISSIFGKEKGHNPWFAAAKSAQIAYVKSMAGQYSEVTFNSICPGHIDVSKPFPDNPKVIGKPEDVAGIVTFLCSDWARHISGAVITVDGGVSSSF